MTYQFTLSEIALGEGALRRMLNDWFSRVRKTATGRERPYSI